MKTPPKSGVLFDLDGVLIDSSIPHARAWQEIFSPLGIDVALDRLLREEGRPSIDVARQIATENNIQLGEAALMELINRKRARYQELAPRGMRPGAGDVVRQVKSRRHPLGMVSGSARESVCAALGGDELALFDVIVAAEDCRRGKPDPEPYLVACRGLGLAPADCIAVENAPLGIASARAAGLRVVALTSTLPASELSEADRIVDDLPMLLDVITRL